jgi:hypothetical protein
MELQHRPLAMMINFKFNFKKHSMKSKKELVEDIDGTSILAWEPFIDKTSTPPPGDDNDDE